ncbi:hypothetical protein [Novosphingobium sp. HII-3]|uniref:hypothetical protein n=1 Tax=Novosphingobium sp. HII-3 TaxID=2075565 RepID=UPI0018EE3544|nr:hypothetical protein [Novosphingobium sp. HII-3]
MHATTLHTVALIEDKAPGFDDQLPPGMRALVQMAERQNGGSTAKVNPLPLPARALEGSRAR